MALSIGVDVGGTKIAAGVVDDDGQVLQTVRRDSPAVNRQAIVDTITTVVRRLHEDFPDAATVGIGAAGFVSSDRNTMAHGTNLDWTGMRIGDVVSEDLDVKLTPVMSSAGRYGAECEQWNDGNNVVALSPGVVVAYDRNYSINANLRAAGIEVLEIPSSELGRGRGGGGAGRRSGFLGVFVASHGFNSTPFGNTPENSHINTYLH